MTQLMVEALRALAYVAPGQKTQLLVKAWEEAARQLPCAEADPLTRQEVRQIRRTMSRIRAEMLGYRRQFSEQQALLERSCKGGDPWACARLKTVHDAPKVNLARLTWRESMSRCSHPVEPPLFIFSPGRPLYVLASGAAVEKPIDWEHHGDRRLEVDRAVRWEHVTRAVKATVTPHEFSWRVVFTDNQGRLMETRLRQPPAVGGGRDSPAEFLTLTLRERGELRITGGDSPIRLPAARPCPRGQVCPNLAALQKQLQILTHKPARKMLKVSFPPRLPWERALSVLVAASCSYGVDQVVMATAAGR